MPEAAVALATSQDHPNLTPDDRLLAEALKTLGIPAEPGIWNDPGVDWTRFRAVVIRSCWDYHLRPTEFLAWLDRLAALQVPVCNPPEAIRWNLDKRYLRELAGKGVPTVPTLWAGRGERVDWKSKLETLAWTRIVIKPTVSASAHATRLLEAPTTAESIRTLERAAGRHAVMVQPYLEQIETSGEWSLMFFGGTYSHGVLKRPAPGYFRTQSEYGGSVLAGDPEPPLIGQAAELLSQLPWPLLYARIDLVEPDPSQSWNHHAEGRPVILELELIEPALFFAKSPGSATRFAAALGRLLER